MTNTDNLKKELEYYYTLYKRAFTIACKESAELKNETYLTIEKEFLDLAEKQLQE